MKVLKLKSKGVLVLKLQNNLVKLGYALTPDGVFGQQTENAVKQFQRDNGLMADGIVGDVTMGILEDALTRKEYLGIDVSYYNQTVDWNKIKASRYSFAIAKASEGQSYKDPQFGTNYSEMVRLDIMRSAYHFYRFFTDPVVQADNFLGCGFDFSQKNTLPPVIDIEWQDNNGSTNQTIINNRTLYIKNIRKWLDKVEAATGRVPMIYTQKSFWDGIVGAPSGFERYPLWVVDYSRNAVPAMPSNFPNWVLWQFSSTGAVDGITGMVDLNRFKGSLTALKKLANY